MKPQTHSLQDLDVIPVHHGSARDWPGPIATTASASFVFFKTFKPFVTADGRR
jgi:hypothetical protein